MASDAGSNTQRPSVVQSAMPSVMPSATASQRPSGRSSPILGPPMPPPTGPGLVAYPALPTANAEPTNQDTTQGTGTMTDQNGRALVPKMKLQDLKDARPYVFNMVIVKIRTASTNYDPEHAISNFNAALQDALGTKSGIEDIPTNMYMVQFQKPDATGGSTNYGKFVCQVPGPMEPLVIDLTACGDLKFTGDGAGNSYQLEWEAFVTPENKKKRREANDKQWCFVIPQTKGNITTVPERQVYERAVDHFANFGLTIQDHENAFLRRRTKNKEQAKPGWHVEFDLNHGRVPIDLMNRFDIRGLKEFVIDPETDERAGVWFNQDNMRALFGACTKCWKHVDACEGHDFKPQQPGKRTSAAEADANAKRRMAKSAKQNFGSGF